MLSWPFALALVAGAPELPEATDFDSWMERAPSLPSPTRAPGWDRYREQPTVLRYGSEPAPRWVSSPASAARWFLQQKGQHWGLTDDALRHLEIHEVHDLGVGTIVVSLHAKLKGVPVFRDEMNVALDQQLRLIGITGQIASEIREAPDGRFGLGRDSALAVALGDAGGSPWQDLRPVRSEDGWVWFEGPELGQPTRVQDVYYPHPTGLRAAYHVELSLDGVGRNEVFAYVVDGEDGRIHFRRSLLDDAFTYRVYADAAQHPADGPNGNDEIPDRSGTVASPPRTFEAPILITLPHSGLSTGDPWLPAGATETAGNNVDAYADISSPDGLTANSNDFRATTTGPDTFDYVYDPNQNASANDQQRSASIVHAFFTTNFLHDDFYDVGFDEAAGNAQDDNFGRGGVAGDDMRVELHDYSGRNNANMSTPSDGGRPRMQMYLWNEIDRVAVRGLSPVAVATDFEARSASFAPLDFDVSADLVAPSDAGANPSDACEPPFSESVAGKIALVEVGVCSFDDQVANLENSGAVGVIIASTGDAPLSLSGSSSPGIGVVSISSTDAGLLRAQTNASLRIQRDEGEEVDSGLDTLVLAHEWGHYISNRLVGNARGLFGNQSRGMGEGWSDFHGLLTTIQADDVSVPGNGGWNAAFAASNTVAFRGPYFGIRRVPYSTDFAKNGLSYRHIQLNEPLPADVPTAFGLNGSQNNRVHRTGEVWATMLWEFYAALLNDPRYDFDEARTKMKSYLVAGYKLTPVAPTIREARDALLLAALGTNRQDFELMFRAFARRGVGATASGPDRFSTAQIPVDESFELEGALLGPNAPNDEAFWCDREGILDAGERGELVIQITNDGMSELQQPTLVLTSTTPGLSFPDGANLSLPVIPAFSTVTTTVSVALEGLSAITLASVEFEVVDPVLTASAARSGRLEFLANFDELPASASFDDVESENSAWTALRSRPDAAGFNRIALSPVQHRWQAFNDGFGAPTDVYLVSPLIDVSANADFIVSFDHRYDIEPGWDGGAIEISADGGGTWDDVSLYADPGYDDPLNDRTSSPLNQTPAYNGRNDAWPGLDVVTLDFGTSFAGQSVLLRYWLSSDQFVTGQGWEIDDIVLTGVTNTPFTGRVPDRGQCINRPPVPVAGRDQVVFEGDAVQLFTESTDPDGDVLDVSWTQAIGPSVNLDPSGGFVAPMVDTDTMLEFDFEVADAEFVRGPGRARVLVRHRNVAPTVMLAGPSQGDERALVELNASGQDPEGAPLRFQWRQLVGPVVGGLVVSTEEGRLSIVLPEVQQATAVTLQVQADDGLLLSEPAFLEILVQQVNRAPEGLLVPHVEAPEKTWVSLVAQGFDPDGDELEFSFAPIGSAPAGIQSGAFYRVLTPGIAQDTRTLRYEVRISDGEFLSDPVEAEILVRNVPPPARPEPPDIRDLFIEPEPEPEPKPAAGLRDGGGCASAPLDGPALWLLLGGLAMVRGRRRRGLQPRAAPLS
ncbi:MAG: M36 family metallopeptidase [Myxococcota bacterium]